MTESEVFDELMDIVADELEHGDSNDIFASAEFTAWYVADVKAGLTLGEHRSLRERAASLARRIAAATAAKNVGRRVPARDLHDRRAPVLAHALEALRFARLEQCAPVIDLPVAAGAGRELLDEECDTWIELPREHRGGNYLALRVAGESMMPVITPGQLVLVELDVTPRVNDVIVARRPDDSYVIKLLASITPCELELRSLNPDFDTIRVPNDSRHVLGKVVARFSRE